LNHFRKSLFVSLLIACMIAGYGCVNRSESEKAQPAWCHKSAPFCELDMLKRQYYYHIEEPDVKVYSIEEFLNYNPNVIVRDFRRAKHCYIQYFEEKFKEKPDLVNNVPVHIMVVKYKHLNGRNPIIDSAYSRRGEDICAITKCTKCDSKWREWDRRSTFYTAEECLSKRNISHETFHQMICRTANWFSVEKRFSKGSDFFEESLAREFENYPCLYEEN